MENQQNNNWGSITVNRSELASGKKAITIHYTTYGLDLKKSASFSETKLTRFLKDHDELKPSQTLIEWYYNTPETKRHNTFKLLIDIDVKTQNRWGFKSLRDFTYNSETKEFECLWGAWYKAMNVKAEDFGKYVQKKGLCGPLSLREWYQTSDWETVCYALYGFLDQKIRTQRFVNYSDMRYAIQNSYRP